MRQYSLLTDDHISSKSVIRAIVANPECGEPLKRKIDGLRKYRVRRFRIVYAVDHKR